MDIGMDSNNFHQVQISVQDFIHQSVLYGGIAVYSCRVVFLVVLGSLSISHLKMQYEGAYCEWGTLQYFTSNHTRAWTMEGSPCSRVSI